MTESNFTEIMNNSLNIDITIANDKLKCPKCGNKMKLMKTYYVDGVKKTHLLSNSFTCENKVNSHSYDFVDYLTFYIDMIEGLSRANENPIQYSNQSIL